MKAKLSNKTYWKVGGNCDHFYEVNSIEEIIQLKKELNQDPVIIGNGTNVLFDSEGFDGFVLKLGKDFSYSKIVKDEIVEVGAAKWVPALVREMSVCSLGGMEHCVGIPATFGGLIAMNGGSQRRSISENLLSVKVLEKNNDINELSINDCDFSYRESIFKNTGRIILSAKIKLNKINKNENRNELLSILSERRKKFPRKIPNCGSVFLSSKELFDKVGPPGLVVETLGLKGLKFGGAKISELHGNFILNFDNAHSSDILALVNIINDKCFLKYGFKLKAEALFYRKDKKVFTLDSALS